jgi:hypothetical protein
MRRVEGSSITIAPVDQAAVRIEKADPALAGPRIESAMQCLRKRIDLVAIATSRKGQDFSAEVIGAARQLD